MSPRLALHFLGPPKLELDTAPVTVDLRKTLALLAYLAVNRREHHRDHISALLWPDYEQAKALTNLRAPAGCLRTTGGHLAQELPELEDPRHQP
jgi:DNA-binding SARP family transcriptional activator